MMCLCILYSVNIDGNECQRLRVKQMYQGLPVLGSSTSVVMSEDGLMMTDPIGMMMTSIDDVISDVNECNIDEEELEQVNF